LTPLFASPQNSAFFERYSLALEEDILGDGSFSVCRRCTLRSSGEDFAVKIVSRRVDCSKEIELLTRCQGHPNVVRLVEVLQVGVVVPATILLFVVINNFKSMHSTTFSLKNTFAVV
jgi:hypothetical protein